MDPLLAAASVAGVAAMGVHLSQTIYNLISTFYEAEKEMSSVANDLSLLAMVLNELEGVLRQDSRVYRRRMVRVVNEILNSCESVFESISKYTCVNAEEMRSSKQFQRKVCWFFQRHRVGPLQAGLESLRSTLNVLLHVVHLARVSEAAESSIANGGTVITEADVQKEKRTLVGVVLDNRRSILNLKQTEEDRDRGQNLRNIMEYEREIEGTKSGIVIDDSAQTIQRSIDPRETTNGCRFDSFGGWGGGSNANIGTNPSLFSKATMDSPTDTTYSSAWSPGGDKKSRNDKITVTDDEKSGVIDEKEDDEANDTKAGGDDWGGSTTATLKNKQKKKDRVDAVPKVTNPIVIDTTLRDAQAAADDSWGASGVTSEKSRNRKEEKKRVQKELKSNNRRSSDASPDLSVLARSTSHSEHVVEVYEDSEAGSSGTGPKSFNGGPERGHANGANELPSPSGSYSTLLSQSPTSTYYSIPPKFPIADEIEAHNSEDISSMKLSRPQGKASAKGLATKLGKSQGSPPETEIVTPTAQWFLSVVPHESSVIALIVRPHSGEANYLMARAEETAKTLLLNWTNVDPDVISGEESFGGWNATDKSSSQTPVPARDEKLPSLPYQMSYTPPAYPTYTPQQWYSPPLITAPPPPDEKQTDSEELARLKKLILDEKAEQDMRAAATAAAAALPAAPVTPIATDELTKDTMRRENTYTEAVDSTQVPQEHNVQWKAEPARLQPVIMRDWLGRKFIFPVDMCQTWEGLHNLIQEAFGRLLEYKPTVEKGCYNISHITGEVILPSTWEAFVQPGLEISMDIWNVLEADREISGGKAMVGGREEKAGPKTLIPSSAPEVSSVGSPMAVRSGNDNESSVDDDTNDDIDCAFPDGVSYVEGSDPRYLSIENVLLEQKKAKVEAEMKLERNRRFFQIKQQLVDQGAAIQALQDAADHAEQDTKLAWLEKQVKDQKEELDRLPPLLTTPPSSSAGDSLSKSPSSPQRRPSLGTRLFSRMPSRSIRSKGSIRSQQMLTEG